jgi:hypothetical protein
MENIDMLDNLTPKKKIMRPVTGRANNGAGLLIG